MPNTKNNLYPLLGKHKFSEDSGNIAGMLLHMARLARRLALLVYIDEAFMESLILWEVNRRLAGLILSKT